MVQTVTGGAEVVAWKAAAGLSRSLDAEPGRLCESPRWSPCGTGRARTCGSQRAAPRGHAVITYDRRSGEGFAGAVLFGTVVAVAVSAVPAVPVQAQDGRVVVELAARGVED